MRGLLERLNDGEIIVGDGSYVVTLEKRGYVKTCIYTPEAACEHPDAVKQLALEYARAGADVTQTFTYGATEGRLEGCSFTPQEINQSACDIAKEVSKSKSTLLAGGITQTNGYTYKEVKDKDAVQKEIINNANILIQNNVDFILLEYFRNVEEMEWAIECIAKFGKPVAASLCIGPSGDAAGVSPGECAVRMHRAGAQVIGANCLFDPFINLEVLRLMKEGLAKEGFTSHLMSQPVGFRTPDGGQYGWCDLPEFPFAMEPRGLTRWEVRKWARAAYELGIRYIGGCCGFEPHHIRAIAEELYVERGRLPEASDKSDHDLELMKKIGQTYQGKKDVETQYSSCKSHREYWINMEPGTGRPKSVALSNSKNTEIFKQGLI